MILKRTMLITFTLITVAMIITVVSGLFTYSKIARVDIKHTSKTTPKSNYTKAVPGSGVTSILLATLGSRGLTVAQGKALGVPDVAHRGADGLTDILMLALVNRANGHVSLLSIPRDTWVETCQCKINSLYNSQGAPALLDQVEQVTGIRPDHLVLINFSAFANLINSVGGVNIYVPNTIKDDYSHLPPTNAGCQVMNGTLALEYVRSRHTQTLLNGGWVADQSGTDFGRINRQQEVISALSRKLLSPSLPLHIPAILSTMGSGLTLDSSLSLVTATAIAGNLATAMTTSSISGFSLPSTTRYINGQSAVLVVPSALVDILNKWRAAVSLPPITALSQASPAAPSPRGSTVPAAPAATTPTTTTAPTSPPAGTPVYYPYGGETKQGLGVNAPTC